MGIFSNSSSSVDTARAVLDGLPEGASPFEILQTVDQKAGDGDVDPDDVVQDLRDAKALGAFSQDWYGRIAQDPMLDGHNRVLLGYAGVAGWGGGTSG